MDKRDAKSTLSRRCALLLILLLDAAAQVHALNWHQQNVGNIGTASNVVWDAIAYGNGLFVATGHDTKKLTGLLATSPDGANWQAQNTGTNRLGSVAYGAGMFLSLVATSGFSGSRDGTNWFAVPFPRQAVLSLSGLSWAGDRFFYCFPLGDGRSIMSSADGTNWVVSYEERYPDIVLGDFAEVAFGSGLYVCVGGKWDGLLGWDVPTVVLSQDLTNWASVFDDLGFQLQHITYGERGFVALSPNGLIFNSHNGTNWFFVGQSFPYLNAVTYGDGLYIAVGNWGTIFESEDGIHWSTADSGSYYALTDVVYGQNTFVAIGTVGRILQSDPVVMLSCSGNAVGALTVRGPLGKMCMIEGTEHLGAAHRWHPLATIELSNTPTLWTDPEASNRTQWFYRATVQP